MCPKLQSQAIITKAWGRKITTSAARWSQTHRCSAELGSIRYATTPMPQTSELLKRRFLGIANLMLQDTVERIYTKDVYADIKRGIYIVRGENVLLLGEIVRAAASFRTEGCTSTNPSTCIRILTKTTMSPNPTAKLARKKYTNCTCRRCK